MSKMKQNEDSRVEQELSRSYGLSLLSASLLLDVAACSEGVVNVSSFSEDGREAVMWLIHRGLLSTSDCMGLLYVRVSESGGTAIRLVRKLVRVAPTSALVSPGVHTTNG